MADKGRLRPALKTFLVLASFGIAFTGAVHADEFKRRASFESVNAFVAAAEAFHPSKAKGEMADLFAVPEDGQPDDPRTGMSVVPERLDHCEILWTDDSQALVFVTASPKTSATRTKVGVLFFLSVWVKAKWTIEDVKRFTASGKYADVTAKLTSGVGTGYHLGTENMNAIVTIEETQGGRGYAYFLSASYTLFNDKFQRLDLE
jgi:hypothetical protein